MVGIDNNVQTTLLNSGMLSNSSSSGPSRGSENFNQALQGARSKPGILNDGRVLLAQTNPGRANPDDLSPKDRAIYDALNPAGQEAYLSLDEQSRFEYRYQPGAVQPFLLQELRTPEVQQRKQVLLQGLATAEGGQFSELANKMIPDRKTGFMVLPDQAYQQFHGLYASGDSASRQTAFATNGFMIMSESYFYSDQALGTIVDEATDLLRYAQDKYLSPRELSRLPAGDPMRIFVPRAIDTPAVNQRVESLLQRFASSETGTPTSQRVAQMVRNEKVKPIILSRADFDAATQITSPNESQEPGLQINGVNNNFFIFMPDDVLFTEDGELTLLHEGSEVLRRKEGQFADDVSEYVWERESDRVQNEYAGKNGLPIQALENRPSESFYEPDQPVDNPGGRYNRLGAEERAVYRGLSDSIQNLYNNAYRADYDNGALLRDLILQADWTPASAQRTEALLGQLSNTTKGTETSQQIAAAVRGGQINVIVLPDSEFSAGLQSAQPDVTPYAARPTTSFTIANTVFVQQSSHSASEGLNQGIVDLMLAGQQALRHVNAANAQPTANPQANDWRALNDLALKQDNGSLVLSLADNAAATGQYLSQFGPVGTGASSSSPSATSPTGTTAIPSSVSSSSPTTLSEQLYSGMSSLQEIVNEAESVPLQSWARVGTARQLESIHAGFESLKQNWGQLNVQQRANQIEDIMTGALNREGLPDASIVAVSQFAAGETQSGITTEGEVKFGVALSSSDLNGPAEAVDDIAHTVLQEIRKSEQLFANLQGAAANNLPMNRVASQYSPILAQRAYADAPGDRGDYAQKMYEAFSQGRTHNEVTTRLQDLSQQVERITIPENASTGDRRNVARNVYQQYLDAAQTVYKLPANSDTSSMLGAYKRQDWASNPASAPGPGLSGSTDSPPTTASSTEPNTPSNAQNFANQRMDVQDFTQRGDLSNADFSKASLNATNFQGVNLQNANFFGAFMESANLSDANLESANLGRAQLNSANLQGANLQAAQLKDANLERGNLQGADLSQTDLTKTNLNNIQHDAQTQWHGAQLTGTQIQQLGLTQAQLAPATATEASGTSSIENHLESIKQTLSQRMPGRDFSNISLTGSAEGQIVNLRGIDLSGADLSGLDLQRVSLREANLSHTNLQNTTFGEGVYLGETNFTGANMRGVVFSPDVARAGDNLSGADLRDSNIGKATFEHSGSLQGANLTGLDLSGASLVGINFSNANLSEADLSNANLSGANLNGTDLTRTNLNNIQHDAQTQWHGAQLTGTQIQQLGLTSAQLVPATATETSGTSSIENHLENIKQTLSQRIPGRDFSNISLTGSAEGQIVNLRGIDLSGADLSGLDLQRVSLREANLSRTNLQNTTFGEGVYLGETNFTGANMRGVVFSPDVARAGDNLSGADLRDSNIGKVTFGLSGSLQGANLTGLDLSGVDLSGASLVGINFSNANLSEADLSNTNLSGASLNGTDLTRTNLNNIQHDAQTQWHGAQLTGTQIQQLGLTPQQLNPANGSSSTPTHLNNPTPPANPDPGSPPSSQLNNSTNRTNDPGFGNRPVTGGFSVNTNLTPNGVVDTNTGTESGHGNGNNRPGSLTAVAGDAPEPNNPFEVSISTGQVNVSGISLQELNLSNNNSSANQTVLGLPLGLREPIGIEVSPAAGHNTSATVQEPIIPELTIPAADTSTESVRSTTPQGEGVTIGGQLGSKGEAEKANTKMEQLLGKGWRQGLRPDLPPTTIDSRIPGYGEGVPPADVSSNDTSWGLPDEPITLPESEGFPEKDPVLDEILNPNGVGRPQFTFPPIKEGSRIPEVPAEAQAALTKALPELQGIRYAQFSQLSTADQQQVLPRTLAYQQLAPNDKTNISLIDYLDSSKTSEPQRQQLSQLNAAQTVQQAQLNTVEARTGLDSSTIDLINARIKGLQANTAQINQQTQSIQQSNAQKISALATQAQTDPVGVAFITPETLQSTPENRPQINAPVSQNSAPIPRFMVVRTENGPKLIENLANGQSQLHAYPLSADTPITRQEPNGAWSGVPDVGQIGSKLFLDLLFTNGALKMLNNGNPVQAPGSAGAGNTQTAPTNTGPAIPQPAF